MGRWFGSSQYCKLCTHGLHLDGRCQACWTATRLDETFVDVCRRKLDEQAQIEEARSRAANRGSRDPLRKNLSGSIPKTP